MPAHKVIKVKHVIAFDEEGYEVDLVGDGTLMVYSSEIKQDKGQGPPIPTRAASLVMSVEEEKYHNG